MKLFLKISAVVLLVGYLAVSLYLWGDNDRNRPCELFEITVADSTECNLLTRDDLRAYLAEAGLLPEGKPMRQVDTRDRPPVSREVLSQTAGRCVSLGRAAPPGSPGNQ
jgi:hypothetical protein